MKKLGLALLATAFVVSCGSDSDDNLTSSSSVNVSGQVSTAKKDGRLNPKGVSALDLSAMRMNCVAFDSAATSGSSDFDSSGAFSVDMPADVPFGCFVIQKNDLSIVATLKIKDSGTGMEDESSSSMSLRSSVNMGSLTLTEGSPVIEVPKSKIDSAASSKTPSVPIDDIHQTEWALSCVDSSDSACSVFVNESPKVYMRLLKATKNSANIYGLGVWASKTAFDNCGGLDMTSTEANAIVTDEGGDFAWSQIETTGTNGGAWNVDGTLCPLRDSGGSDELDNLKFNYTTDKLVVSGGSYTLNDEYEETYSNCYRYGKTAITFSPGSSSVMYGNFETVDVVADHNNGTCGDSDAGTNDKASFVVKFTKQ